MSRGQSEVTRVGATDLPPAPWYTSLVPLPWMSPAAGLAAGLWWRAPGDETAGLRPDAMEHALLEVVAICASGPWCLRRWVGIHWLPAGAIARRVGVERAGRDGPSRRFGCGRASCVTLFKDKNGATCSDSPPPRSSRPGGGGVVAVAGRGVRRDVRARVVEGIHGHAVALAFAVPFVIHAQRKIDPPTRTSTTLPDLSGTGLAM